MKPFNVEIFKKDFTYRSSCQKQSLEYEFDYLSIEQAKITLLKINAEFGDYIRITRDNLEICGIVVGVEKKDEGTELTFNYFYNILDISVLKKSEELTTLTIEQWLGKKIRETYVENADTLQNIQGLTVEIQTGTSGTCTKEDEVVNLYDLALDSFMQYEVIIEFHMNVQQKEIRAVIGKNLEKIKTIESDLPNIRNPSFVDKESKQAVNKLILVNQSNLSESIIYYRHVDNTISTVDVNRVEPVIFQIMLISPGTSGFQASALEKAKSTLVQDKYDNLIELTVFNNDSMINPLNLRVGQNTSIIRGDTVYQTILTGFKYKEEEVTLVFGAVRTELTKKLKRGVI